jgi:hypothetical protein
MLGIVIGTLCLFGFIAVWRRRYGFYGPGFGHGCGPGRGRYGHGRFGWRRGFGLYRVFEELDTSPGQEKAIRGALGELRGAFAALRPQLVGARQSLATAITSEPFDAAALEHGFSGRLAEASSVSSALAAAVGKIHDALDADQRKRLARLVDALPYGRAF